ncbi:FAD binding domain-containing protein [Jatrophihabitans sp. DSM 45814]
MIPAQFDYVRAESAAHTIELLSEHGEDAKLIAGGHSLLPMMKLRLAYPTVLLDVARIAELSYIRLEGSEVAIGALTRHGVLAASQVLHQEVPLLSRVASLVGDPQVRHRGTLGGSLAHADPAADLPTAITVLEATLILQGPGGKRAVPASDFFLGYFETALGPDEMIVEVRVERTGDSPWDYQKFTRRANDWAIVAAATVRGRVALANMGSVPIRALATEQALAAGADLSAAAELAADETAPVVDMHANEEYRRHLARLLTRRALQHAAARTQNVAL